MGHEAAGVAGDRVAVFAQADPGGLVADNPGADQQVPPIKLWQRSGGLVDPTSAASI
jgi:hypothetical protein